jgi:hypothetical protein
MTWHLAKTQTGDCFPIFVKDQVIEIPHQNINSKFTIDDDWLITETYPNVITQDGTELIEWKTKTFAQLVTFQPMIVHTDYNRHIKKMEGFLGKTVLIDDKRYTLSILKRNFVDGAYFSAKDENGNYQEIRINNYKMYIGDENAQWVEKPIVIVQ